MSSTAIRVLSLCIFGVVAGNAWASGYGHSGGNQGPGGAPKKEAPAAENPQSAAFDPSAATDVVSKTATGGMRRVVANESSDAKQIGLIRANLKSIADNFGPASISDPALGAVRATPPGTLRAQYVEIRAGAEVRFSSADPQLVGALQAWLDGQQSSAGAANRDGPTRTLP